MGLTRASLAGDDTEDSGPRSSAAIAKLNANPGTSSTYSTGARASCSHRDSPMGELARQTSTDDVLKEGGGNRYAAGSATLRLASAQGGPGAHGGCWGHGCTGWSTTWVQQCTMQRSLRALCPGWPDMHVFQRRLAGSHQALSNRRFASPKLAAVPYPVHSEFCNDFKLQP